MIEQRETMSKEGNGLVKAIVLGLLIAGAVGTIGVSAEATPGNVRASVNVPTPAQCSGSSGTALAVVSGGKAGFPKITVLLVTSCGSGPVNPSSSPTPVERCDRQDLSDELPGFSAPQLLPSSGWEALVLRSNKGDLLACGTNTAASTTVLWSVDFSPFNNTNPPSNPPVPDGTATFLGTGPLGSSCDGIAWDATDKTIYLTPATVGANVLHFSRNPGRPARDRLDTGRVLHDAHQRPRHRGHEPLHRLHGAGHATVVAPTINQVYKADGSPVRSFAAPSSNPAGLPDDATTLTSEYKESALDPGSG